MSGAFDFTSDLSDFIRFLVSEDRDVLLYFLRALVDFLLRLFLTLNRVIWFFLTSFDSIFKREVLLGGVFLVLLLRFFIDTLRFVLVFLERDVGIDLDFNGFERGDSCFLEVRIDRFDLHRDSRQRNRRGCR